MNEPPTLAETILGVGPVTAIDRLLTIYRAPSPHVTAYLATADGAPPGSDGPMETRWRALRDDLAEAGTPPAALEAIDDRLTLPLPDDVAGVAVIAASDGTTVVQHGPESPRVDVAVVETLPYAGPLLDWQQRTVPHVVVAADETGADVVTFGVDLSTTLDSYDQPVEELIDTVADSAVAIGARMVAVAGPDELVKGLIGRLRTALPADCEVVDSGPLAGPAALAESTVRLTSDLVARQIVDLLGEHRSLAARGGAVEGTEATVAALADGTAARLLVHDDPRDERSVWIGRDPRQISVEEGTDRPASARLVDAAIRSAVLQGIPVTIVPSTGSGGPADDTGAILRQDRPGDERVGRGDPAGGATAGRVERAPTRRR